MTDITDEDIIYRTSTIQMPVFEGASTDYRNAQRTAYLGDADLLAINELQLLQARSRDVTRNNSISSAAVNKLITKLGAITVQWKTPEGEKHEVMQEIWDEFYSSPCLDGYGNGDTMQATWNFDRITSGEALARLVLDMGTTNKVKLKVQNIESDYLPISYSGQEDSTLPIGKTRYGITFDDNNKPTYYHFYAENYFGMPNVTPNNYTMRKVLSNDILHIFHRTRSNQWRGIPEVAPMLLEIYNLDDLKKATVDKQKAAAAISWIIEQASQMDINAVGSARTIGKTTSTDTNKKIIFQANGGSVQYTNPGDRFVLAQSSDIGNNFLGLLKHELQAIAAGYGIPYYMLSGDTDGLSFSAIRGILIEFRNKLEYIHNFINLPNGLMKLTARFKDIARFSFPVMDAVPSYQFPRSYGVDELKDIQSDLLELQVGATTIERIQSERGVTMEEVLASRANMVANGLEELLTPPNAASTTNGGQEANSNSSSN